LRELISSCVNNLVQVVPETNHVAMVSHAEDVVKVVKTAAESVAVPEAALV